MPSANPAAEPSPLTHAAIPRVARTALTLITGPGDGVDFGLEGGSLVVNVGFTSWAESGGCGVPFQYPGTALTSGHIPLSAIGSPTITVDLSSTTATPDGEKVSRGSGTLTLHRVQDQLSAQEFAIGPATLRFKSNVNLWVRTKPPGATVQSYQWEMRRSNSPTWTTLARTPNPAYNFKAQLAGHFKLRTVLNGVQPTPDVGTQASRYPTDRARGDVPNQGPNRQRPRR